MPGLQDHMDGLFTTPESGGIGPPPAAVDTSAPVVAPPVTPTAPAADTLKPALRTWLLQQVSGQNVLTPEMYQHLNGDDILAQVQKFDPSARWTLVDISGGEGGSAGQGLRLDFDPAKMPAVAGPGGGRSIYETGLVPVYDDSKLHNPNMIYDDPYYGRLTVAANVVKPKQDWWVTAAPLVIAGLATAGAGIPALAAGGGIAAEGGTAAVTGAAAGLDAANIAAGGAGSWWSQLLQKSPSLLNQTPNGPFTPAPTPYTPPAAPATVAAPNALGIPTEYTAAAFGGGNGSPKKVGTNDSSLVATQFADDPYRFSS